MGDKHKSRSTEYLGMIYNDPGEFKHSFEKLVKAMRAKIIAPETTAIAFRGMSGAAVAFGASMRLKMPLIGIRKDADGSHFTSSIKNLALGEYGRAIYDCKHYVIVDDMIDTGKTIHEIVETVGDMLKLESIFLYSDSYGSQIFPHENATPERPLGSARFLQGYPDQHFPIHRSLTRR